jgi:hypothetical protein
MLLQWRSQPLLGRAAAAAAAAAAAVLPLSVRRHVKRWVVEKRRRGGAGRR